MIAVTVARPVRHELQARHLATGRRAAQRGKFSRPSRELGCRLKRQSWQIWLLSIAFLVGALVPPGYMLAPPGPSGLAGLVICTANGAKRIDPGLPGFPDEAPANEPSPLAESGPCPFGSPSSAVLPSLLGSAAPAADWQRTIPFPPPAPTVATPRHTWQARAPPSRPG